MIRTVGEEIDRLEGELKALVPGLVYVDLETDKGRAEKAMAQIASQSSGSGIYTADHGRK